MTEVLSDVFKLAMDCMHEEKALFINRTLESMIKVVGHEELKLTEVSVQSSYYDMTPVLVVTGTGVLCAEFNETSLDVIQNIDSACSVQGN